MLDIAITGAGPIGLSLARLLLKSSISPQITVTIYEKDTSAISRHSLGGTLDLHPPTGLAAIRTMDLWDEFCEHARFDGEEIRICDLNGTVYAHQKNSPQIKGHESRPEIDRVRLMEVLLHAVPEDIVKWGKAVAETVEDERAPGKWTLKFEDGSEAGPFDLVVGADGAWSKVRKVLTDVEPSYAGISGVSGTIDRESAGEQWPKILGMVGKGNNFSSSYHQNMMAQLMGDGSVKTAFFSRQDLEWVKGMKEKCTGDCRDLKQQLLEMYKDWVPDFQSWILCSKDLWCTALWELPVGHRFNHKTGITCIGDAAHLMTPFAGEGVNAGMRDALDLAVAIEKAVNGENDISLAVQQFEESMFARAAEFMEDTLANKEGMFAADAPYGFFTSTIRAVSREVGYDISKGWLWWIPVSKMCYSILWTVGTFGALRRRAGDHFKRSRNPIAT